MHVPLIIWFNISKYTAQIASKASELLASVYENDAYSVLKCCQRTEKCQTNDFKVEVSMKATKSHKYFHFSFNLTSKLAFSEYMKHLFFLCT